MKRINSQPSMQHLEFLHSYYEGTLPTKFVDDVTGKYYTHSAVADHLTKALLRSINSSNQVPNTINIVDPFAGDGRLVEQMIQVWCSSGFPEVKWRVVMWDVHEEGLFQAQTSMSRLVESGLDITYECIRGDSFTIGRGHDSEFDIVISNPPWEMLKPDPRYLKDLPPDIKERYIQEVRKYDIFLGEKYPASQPRVKFAGWGTNLSRVGIDLCRYICKPLGRLGLVMPASFLADSQSIAIRQSLFEEFDLTDVAYFPAEAKLYGKADVSSSTLVLSEKANPNVMTPTLTLYDREVHIREQSNVTFSKTQLENLGFTLPVSMGPKSAVLLAKMSSGHPKWSDLEHSDNQYIWSGRELDETGKASWLTESGDGPLFLKGSSINRFWFDKNTIETVNKENWAPPKSTKHQRIVWRDISRPNQKRRMIATIIPPGYVTGNSLGVAHLRIDDHDLLKILLAVVNSLCFEFQLRARSATGHVSLASLREVHIPSLETLSSFKELVPVVSDAIEGTPTAPTRLEAIIAKNVYQLSKSDFEQIIDTFPKFSGDEKHELLDQYDVSSDNTIPKIPNHVTAGLSPVDMQMVLAVPPGGNWKDIPESIPSKRLDQIRVSYAEGKGSRSTYYGRLKAENPSYTITTYFNRPGNGCNMHYSQDRVISQREAARLQSFPDSFVFQGSTTQVNKQIGNAVPPLLGYQIGRQISDYIGGPGMFLDLFAGCGGLSLGFIWAGWTPIVGNDIEKSFLATYSKNVHPTVVHGSITDQAVQDRIVDYVAEYRQSNSEKPLWIIGGPPCQGFSTANRYQKILDDNRNKLVWDYKRVLERIKPDGFLFENVTGLLNIDKGRVFTEIKASFQENVHSVDGWLLSAENYAVPQRRKRIFLIGVDDPSIKIEQPEKITSMDTRPNLFGALPYSVSVQDAISDLPPLVPGQDGSMLGYLDDPKTRYQEFCRGRINASELLGSLVTY